MQAGYLSLEQALVLLLLVLLLQSHAGRYRRFAPLIVFAAMVLSLVHPLFTWEVSWSVVSSVVMPVLLWQVGMDLAAVETFGALRACAPWLGTVLLIAVAAALTGLVPATGAIVVALLVATLMWGMPFGDQRYGAIDALGPLVVAILLTEIDLDLHPVTRWLGSPFSGGGVGVLIGLGAVRLVRRTHSRVVRDIVLLGSAYLAYMAEMMQRSSGISAALMAGLMSGAYGYHLGIWPGPQSLPSLTGRRGVLAILGGFTLWLGWQTHANLEASLFLPLLLTFGAGLLVWGFLHFFGGHFRLDVATGRHSGDRLLAILLLLAAAGLWWPRTPAPSWGVLLTAMGVAILALVLVYIVPYRLAQSLDIPLRRPGIDHAAKPQRSKEGDDSWLNW